MHEILRGKKEKKTLISTIFRHSLKIKTSLSMEWQGPVSPVLMVVNNTAIHRKLESKGFPQPQGSFGFLSLYLFWGSKLNIINLELVSQNK